MKLLWSSRSPFVRKVMVAAHEVGVAGRLATERVVVAADKPNPGVMALNPLNKIPTLVLDDGAVLFDSRVIAEYLDTLHDGPKLFPAEPAARWRALRCRDGANLPASTRDIAVSIGAQAVSGAGGI